MIAFFVLLTLILGGFVYIAGHGVPTSVAQWLLPDAKGKIVHTGFAGVVAHGGEASKSIAHHRNMESKLARLGWHVEVVGLAALEADRVGEVRMLLRDRDGGMVPDVAVKLGLGRPGQPIQVSHALAPASDGSYRTQVELPAAGEWLARLTLEHAGEHIVFDRVLGGD
jgi:nitrogen fixation protein FixH